jgi:sec-independent protein translocase protein TatA
MFGLSLGHLLIIGVVALLFGSKRLPELGTAVGKTIRSLKEGLGKKP